MLWHFFWISGIFPLFSVDIIEGLVLRITKHTIISNLFQPSIPDPNLTYYILRTMQLIKILMKLREFPV